MMEGEIGLKFLYKNEMIESSVLKTNRVVGLYFSASWSPYCQCFTPILIDFYNEINAEEKQFEVILVPRDLKKEDFDEYYGKMPWLSLPYEDSRIALFIEKYAVKGFPNLIILKKNGEIASKTGKNDIINEEKAAFEKWQSLL
jgi:nucleoredoxin